MIPYCISSAFGSSKLHILTWFSLFHLYHKPDRHSVLFSRRISKRTALSVLSTSVPLEVSTQWPLAFDRASAICTKAALEIDRMQFVKILGEQKSTLLMLPFRGRDATCVRLIDAKFLSPTSRVPSADALGTVPTARSRDRAMNSLVAARIYRRRSGGWSPRSSSSTR
jgi:hypothetical protein